MEADKEVKEEVKKEPATEKPKKEPREKRVRPERKNEYEYNADIIDQNTVIPALPKKGELIPKPDMKQYKEKEKALSHRIEEIINKKKDIRAEKFSFKKRAQQGDKKHNSLQSEFSEVQQLRDKLAELKVERNKLGDELHDSITRAKANNEKIKEYRQNLKGSRENFAEKLRELEHTQMTKDLNKNQEKEINTEIMMLKRKIKDAESSGNIEIKLEQAEDLKEELDEKIDSIKTQKNPLDKEVDALRQELDGKKKNIDGLKDTLSAEKSERDEEKEKHNKEYEAWKEGKKQRLDKLENDIVKIRGDNEKLWDQFHAKQDEYWKQKQLIDFIEWQQRVKQRKINEKERESRKAEYEAREKQFEKEEKMKKFIGEIETINLLINYLNGFKQTEEKVEEKKEVKVDPKEISSKLNADAQWKKEKGFEVLQSKKSKEDEQPEKKHKKKNKKNKEQKPQEKFNIPYNIEALFERIKIAAPSSAEQIDAKIKELKDREELFERVAKEESTEEEAKLAEEIKGKDTKAKKAGKKGDKNAEDDFPSI